LQDPNESRIESRDTSVDQPAPSDVIVESVDDDVERFNIEQMRALIQQLENENSTLRRNVRCRLIKIDEKTTLNL